MAAPYRDDDDALRARLRSLTDQLEVGQVRARELRELEQNGSKLEREVAGIRRELDRREAKRRAAAAAPAPTRMRRRVMLSAVGGGVVAAGAWAMWPPGRRPPGPVELEPGTVPSGPPPVAVDPALLERLSAGAVYHDRFPRQVLYTWTTAAQVDELQRTRVLLSKSRSATKGQSFFDRRREENPSSVALMFSEPALVRRRFAWTSPWATVRGVGAAETYGDRLVRVTLKPEAIFAYYGGKDTYWWSFHDLDGKPVGLDEMAAHPHRVAGVFHTFDGAGGAGPYREFVLCNESMIEEWSIDTPEIQAEVAASIDLLRRLRAAIEKDPPDLAAMAAGAGLIAREVWAHDSGAPSLAALYEANLAFPGARYRLDVETIDATLAALASLPTGVPIRHRPTRRFPGFTEGAVAWGPSPVHRGSNSLPSMRSNGWAHAVKCLPRGTFGCTPLGEGPLIIDLGPGGG